MRGSVSGCEFGGAEGVGEVEAIEGWWDMGGRITRRKITIDANHGAAMYDIDKI
jgi:hypothetical protein